jgi:hypothetical protein
MNPQISFPPLRDLPPGHLAAREQHLLSEIARDQERPHFSLLTIPVFERRRSWRPVAVVAFAVAALAAIVAATPAWALVRDALPFWNQPSAPSSVQVQFSSLNRGAPAGMSPDAISGETRQVEQVTLGGTTRTLWVSPAKNVGFCYLWLPGLPGGCSTAAQHLAWAGESVPAHEPSQPAQTTGIPESTPPGQFVLDWIAGDITAPANDVVVRFSDGSSAHPQITWVSAPINAGFFAYAVPSDKESSTNHVTAIESFDSHGALVKEQTFLK